MALKNIHEPLESLKLCLIGKRIEFRTTGNENSQILQFKTFLAKLNKTLADIFFYFKSLPARSLAILTRDSLDEACNEGFKKINKLSNGGSSGCSAVVEHTPRK